LIDVLSRPEVIKFVHQHEDDDLSKLVLAQSKHKNIPVQLAVSQIQSRKKAKTKLPEWYSIQGILFPHGVPIEQCSSEITANYKARLIQGDSLVDLTGGTGIDTYYLSKNFKSSTFIEKNNALCDLASYNFKTLNCDISIKNSSAEEYLKFLNRPVDCLYIDPARRDQNSRKVFRIEDCTPNLVDLQNILVEKSKCILVKFSPLLDLSQITRLLTNISDIHIVSINNECKELLVVINKASGGIRVKTINFVHDGEQLFDFELEEEQKCAVDLSMPDQFLYEPNSSIMKAGAFKLISSVFDVKKLHSNSHLYTSKKIVKEFPGRSFEIIAVEALKKNVIKKLLPDGMANISTRNFPMSVPEIRKKTGLKDGGEYYLFATTLMNGNKNIILCKKCQF
jgi:16S rRNA G966 N2-methylase RsmD